MIAALLAGLLVLPATLPARDAQTVKSTTTGRAEQALIGAYRDYIQRAEFDDAVAHSVRLRQGCGNEQSADALARHQRTDRRCRGAALGHRHQRQDTAGHHDDETTDSSAGPALSHER
ncbi:MAG: hypothetical protein WAK53_04640 [Chromatiaceae bacterium]